MGMEPCESSVSWSDEVISIDENDASMRRNFARARGKNFYAGGWGKYGPYVTVTRRVSGRTYAKASIGVLGPRVGVKHSGTGSSVQAMVNLSTGRPSFSYKRKRS